LEKTLETIITGVNTAKGYLKDKIEEYKADRKQSGEGIESGMFIVLKKFGLNKGI
jgi:hypothetical protein